MGVIIGLEQIGKGKKYMEEKEILGLNIVFKNKVQ